MFKFIVFIIISVSLTGCLEEKEEKWTAFLYPNKLDSNKNIKSPMTFKNLEECKKASILQLEKLNIKETGTFKCGLNCIYHEGMKKEICSKILSEEIK